MEIAILSIVLVALSYFFSIFKLELVAEKLVSSGVTGTAIVAYITESVANFDGKFVVLVWACIGGALYFLYLSLARFYSSVYNFILIKTQFVHNEIGLPKLGIKRVKRILIHLAVALYYVFFLGVLFALLMPFSEVIRKSAEAKLFAGFRYGQYFSLLAPFAYWVLITTSFTLIAKKLKQIVIGEQLAEAHLPDELDSSPFSTAP